MASELTEDEGPSHFVFHLLIIYIGHCFTLNDVNDILGCERVGRGVPSQTSFEALSDDFFKVLYQIELKPLDDVFLWPFKANGPVNRRYFIFEVLLLFAHLKYRDITPIS